MPMTDILTGMDGLHVEAALDYTMRQNGTTP